MDRRLGLSPPWIQHQPVSSGLSSNVIASHDFTHWLISVLDDVNGHGTHVAGIAAALTNNNVGVAGVSYSARLLNAKVMDDSGKGSASMLANGIYLATEHGASVINMSLGGSSDRDPGLVDQVFDPGVNEVVDAINYAWTRNVVLVAAAGNTGTTGHLWPAACSHVLSAANTRSDDRLDSTSTYGTWVDVAAAGRTIWSTAVQGASTCGASTGSYANCSGTSMSAPYVSGLAALVRACLLTNPESIVDRITGTADAIAGTGSNFQFGRVNALRAVCFRAPTNLRSGTVSSTSPAPVGRAHAQRVVLRDGVSGGWKQYLDDCLAAQRHGELVSLRATPQFNPTKASSGRWTTGKAPALAPRPRGPAH